MKAVRFRGGNTMGSIVFTVMILAAVAAAFGALLFSKKGESILSKSILAGVGAAAGCVLSGWAAETWAGTLEGLIVGVAAYSCFVFVVCTGVILSRLDGKQEK